VAISITIRKTSSPLLLLLPPPPLSSSSGMGAPLVDASYCRADGDCRAERRMGENSHGEEVSTGATTTHHLPHPYYRC